MGRGGQSGLAGDIDLSYFTSKIWALGRNMVQDAEQQHWSAFSIVVIKHPCPFSFEKGSGKSQRVDLCRGMEAFPGSPDLCFWGLGAWLWEVTKLYFAEFLILEYFHNIDYNG